MPIRKTLRAVASTLGRKFATETPLPGETRPSRDDPEIKDEKFLNWGYICSGLPHEPKKALEIGSEGSPVIPAMLALGYDVTVVDRDERASRYLSGIHFIAGDFMGLDLRPGFDVIVSCSSIENIGLSERHGSLEDSDRDLNAMRAIGAMLNRNGLFFLTIPVGSDTVIDRWRRVYGRGRLPKLLAGFDLVDYRFLVKEPHGSWCAASADAALEFPAGEKHYALGQMILRNERDVGSPIPNKGSISNKGSR